MKRVLSLILILALSLALFPHRSGALADEIMYASDFSEGTDGFYPRSMGDAVLSAENGAIIITGRSSDWHSPGRDFDLVPGEVYSLSVEVFQSEADEAEFILSVAHTKNGTESYENLGRVKAKRGEWTSIACVYTAGNYERFVLYVETMHAPALSYSIRSFTVSGKTASFGAEGIPSLKETYAGLFDFGAALTETECLSDARMSFCAGQFAIVTPGNELKPDFVLDLAGCRRLAAEDETAVAVNIDHARPMLNFAMKYGLKVHGHVFVWHQQTPEAFFHESYDVSKPLVSRDVMLKRLENYMAAVFEITERDYPGLIVSWDVLNEAISDSDGSLRPSKWLTVVGEDYPERAFALARKTAPEGVLLYYNDYNTAIPVKRGGIMALLKRLMAEGNIDGYGFQMHNSVGDPQIIRVAEALKDVSSLGLRLRVSEMDVGVSKTDDASFAAQADYYRELMKLFIHYADQMEAVQVWGVTDDLSWRAKNYPLLFDRDGQPKPAFYAVIDALQ